MKKTLLFVVSLLMLVSVAFARDLKTPLRPEIKAPQTTQCSGKQYILPTIALKTLPQPMTSREVAAIVKPQNMPQMDQFLLADQIAVINLGKKQGDCYPTGAKLQVPVYKIQNSILAQADMRNWQYAVFAGYRWGVSPAFLLAVRNHENPHNDSFALGVMHVRGQGMWKQFEQGAAVIKALIAERQHWDAMAPTAYTLLRCGQSYAEGSCSWGPSVWALYKRATGR